MHKKSVYSEVFGRNGGAARLTWSKMAVFLDFMSKDFGELGSLFERSAIL